VGRVVFMIIQYGFPRLGASAPSLFSEEWPAGRISAQGRVRDSSRKAGRSVAQFFASGLQIA
jgi:hypothetical protein